MAFSGALADYMQGVEVADAMADAGLRQLCAKEGVSRFVTLANAKPTAVEGQAVLCVLSKSRTFYNKNAAGTHTYGITNLRSHVGELTTSGTDFLKAIPEGSVVLVINPHIEDRITTHSSNKTEAVLRVRTGSQVVKIGKAQFYGICGAPTMRGEPCKQATDTNGGNYCFFHDSSRHRQFQPAAAVAAAAAPGPGKGASAGAEAKALLPPSLPPPPPPPPPLRPHTSIITGLTTSGANPAFPAGKIVLSARPSSLQLRDQHTHTVFNPRTQQNEKVLLGAGMGMGMGMGPGAGAGAGAGAGQGAGGKRPAAAEAGGPLRPAKTARGPGPVSAAPAPAAAPARAAAPVPAPEPAPVRAATAPALSSSSASSSSSSSSAASAAAARAPTVPAVPAAPTAAALPPKPPAPRDLFAEVLAAAKQPRPQPAQPSALPTGTGAGTGTGTGTGAASKGQGQGQGRAAAGSAALGHVSNLEDGDLDGEQEAVLSLGQGQGTAGWARGSDGSRGLQRRDGSVAVPEQRAFNFATGINNNNNGGGGSGARIPPRPAPASAPAPAQAAATSKAKPGGGLLGSVDASKAAAQRLVMVGGVLLDLNELGNRKKQQQGGAGGKQQLKPAAPAAAAAAAAVSAQMNAEIEALLSRRSKHAEEADDEWFEQYGARLDKMAKKESQQEHVNKQHSLSVRAFLCKECKSHSEALPALCRQQGHTIVPVNTSKRFFACQRCRHTSYTLGDATASLPKHPCQKCSNFAWVPCGYQGKAADNKPLAEPLVLAASDYNNRNAGIDMFAAREAQL